MMKVKEEVIQRNYKNAVN